MAHRGSAILIGEVSTPCAWRVASGAMPGEDKAVHAGLIWAGLAGGPCRPRRGLLGFDQPPPISARKTLLRLSGLSPRSAFHPYSPPDNPSIGLYNLYGEGEGGRPETDHPPGRSRSFSLWGLADGEPISSPDALSALWPRTPDSDRVSRPERRLQALPPHVPGEAGKISSIRRPEPPLRCQPRTRTARVRRPHGSRSCKGDWSRSVPS